jgi:hypothetical protein
MERIREELLAGTTAIKSAAEKLLDSTAAITEPAAKAKTKGESKVEAGAERNNDGNRHVDRRGDHGDGDDDPPIPGRKLLTRHLCARYRVSDRTIDRWVRDPRLNFPKPLVINGRRFFDEAEIAAFDAKQKEAAVA